MFVYFKEICINGGEVIELTIKPDTIGSNRLVSHHNNQHLDRYGSRLIKRIVMSENADSTIGSESICLAGTVPHSQSGTVTG